MDTVIILLERELGVAAAEALAALHHQQPQAFHYEVLLPAGDSPVKLQSSLAALGVREVDTYGSPVVAQKADELENDREDQRMAAAQRSADKLRQAGTTSAAVVHGNVIDHLVQRVETDSAYEVVIVARYQPVAELLQVDWASQARHRLSVPVLHLDEDGRRLQ